MSFVKYILIKMNKICGFSVLPFAHGLQAGVVTPSVTALEERTGTIPFFQVMP